MVITFSGANKPSGTPCKYQRRYSQITQECCSLSKERNSVPKQITAFCTFWGVNGRIILKRISVKWDGRHRLDLSGSG